MNALIVLSARYALCFFKHNIGKRVEYICFYTQSKPYCMNLISIMNMLCAGENMAVVATLVRSSSATTVMSQALMRMMFEKWVINQL